MVFFHLFVLFLGIIVKFAYSVSLCQTTIYINSVAHTFHTDFENNLADDALIFCEKYVISSVECDRIISHHREKCFSKAEKAVESVKDSEVKAVKAKHSNIDYSEKVGPILPVHGANDISYSKKSEDSFHFSHSSQDQDQIPVPTNKNEPIYYLQTYKNEKPLAAVKRFCGTLHMNEFQCTQIRRRFCAMYDEFDATIGCSALAEEMGSSHPQSHVSGGASSYYWSKIEKIYDELIYQGTLYFQEYAFYIMLATAVVYVIIVN